MYIYNIYTRAKTSIEPNEIVHCLHRRTTLVSVQGIESNKRDDFLHKV